MRSWPQDGLDPISIFHALLREYGLDPLHGPFNDAARTLAGMTPQWYEPVAAARR